MLLTVPTRCPHVLPAAGRETDRPDTESVWFDETGHLVATLRPKALQAPSTGSGPSTTTYMEGYPQ